MSVSVTWKLEDAPLKQLIANTGGPAVRRVIADGVEYGVWIETGTSRMPARPCAKPAVEAVQSGFEKAFMNKLTDAQVGAAVTKTAFDIERLWKQNIVEKGAVDTGAYLNSVHVEQS